MTNEEILEAVKNLEKKVANPSLPDAAKAIMNKKIAELQAQVIKAEEKIEKIEEKQESSEKKAQSELQETIDKLEKSINNPSIPASARDLMKKKLDAAKEKMKSATKEAKEDKKEAAAEKKDIKAAVDKLEAVAKKVRKTPIKKGAKAPKAPKVAPIVVPKIKQKKRQQKSIVRTNKLKSIMTDLQKLIDKNKKLAYYKGAGVDLEKDAKRGAKPRGYRFVGKHDYRDPKKVLSAEEFKKAKKRGVLDYEARPNRSDALPEGNTKKIVLPKKAKGIQLAKGGSVDISHYKVNDEIFIDYEDAMNYCDKNNLPYSKIKKTKAMAHGGSVDADRFAKPKGWRWKDSAVEDGIITRASLSKSPSEKMRAKYPDYVAFENRKDKSDKRPYRKYRSV